MREISIPEFGRISRAELGGVLLRRLQAFDEAQVRTTGESAFDWSRMHFIRARSYVGVVQVPGLTVEILPKVDSSTELDGHSYRKDDSGRLRAQENLLYMLSFTRRVPILERDLAALQLHRMPLLESLLRIFVERLLEELRRGIEHAYVTKEENSKFIKGKLLLSEQVRQNITRRDRTYVAFDDFSPDIWLNRILRATCSRLLEITSVPRTQQRLREAMLYLGDAGDCQIRQHHFEQVFLNRNAARFREIVDFCWVVLMRSTPAPSAGNSRTFSLLFRMESLFERFIAGFIWKYAEDFGYSREQIHIQAVERRKWLLQDRGGQGRFRLKPDIVFEQEAGSPCLILDTKWKRLKPDNEHPTNGVDEADLYQLYAYAHRFGSTDNVLLYPAVEGATAKRYRLAGEAAKEIRIEFIDLNRDLRGEKIMFRESLRSILCGVRMA